MTKKQPILNKNIYDVMINQIDMKPHKHSPAPTYASYGSVTVKPNETCITIIEKLCPDIKKKGYFQCLDGNTDTVNNCPGLCNDKKCGKNLNVGDKLYYDCNIIPDGNGYPGEKCPPPVSAPTPTPTSVPIPIHNYYGNYTVTTGDSCYNIINKKICKLNANKCVSPKDCAKYIKGGMNKCKDDMLIAGETIEIDCSGKKNFKD